jgi:hypothetical protein
MAQHHTDHSTEYNHHARGYNELAIVALALIVVFPPLSPFFGIPALRQIKRTDEKGGVFAWIGIIIGGLVIAACLAAIIFAIVASNGTAAAHSAT